MTVEAMHGWESCDTARCERCSIYTPTTDLVFSEGRAYCTSCGVPRLVEDDWTPSQKKKVEHPARVAALVMLAVTLMFPLAACVSQL